MVALIPIGGALRDIITALGQGLMLCLYYRVLRLLLGDEKLGVFLCDIILLLSAGLYYRAAAAGAFEGGTMRWYTVLSALISYFISYKVTNRFFSVYMQNVKTALLKPVNLLNCYIFAPFLKEIKAKIHYLAQKTTIKFNRKVKKCKNNLQNKDRVLYNI